MKNILLLISLIFLSALAYSQVLSNKDTLHWRENRALEWKDFISKPTDLPGVTGQATLIMNARFDKSNPLKRTATVVETLFDKKKSWATKEDQTAQKLKYYQTLFNLYEVASRKLRKQFKETKFGLDPDRIFQEKYDAALAELSERDELFKEETDTGEDPAALEKWSKKLQLELKELEAYKK